MATINSIITNLYFIQWNVCLSPWNLATEFPGPHRWKYSFQILRLFGLAVFEVFSFCPTSSGSRTQSSLCFRVPAPFSRTSRPPWCTDRPQQTENADKQPQQQQYQWVNQQHTGHTPPNNAHSQRPRQNKHATTNTTAHRLYHHHDSCYLPPQSISTRNKTNNNNSGLWDAATTSESAQQTRTTIRKAVRQTITIKVLQPLCWNQNRTNHIDKHSNNNTDANDDANKKTNWSTHNCDQNGQTEGHPGKSEPSE